MRDQRDGLAGMCRPPGLDGIGRARKKGAEAFARMLATAVTGTAAHELIRDAMSR